MPACSPLSNSQNLSLCSAPLPPCLPGWRYEARPEHSQQGSQPSATAAPQPSQSAAEAAEAAAAIWQDPRLPASADVLLLPPVGVPSPPPHNPLPSAVVTAPLAIFRRLDFDSELRRMSVAVMHMLPAAAAQGGGEAGGARPPITLLVKGAPEG